MVGWAQSSTATRRFGSQSSGSRQGFARGKTFEKLKKVWRDGTRFVTLDPYELIARICAMVPPPRFHMVRIYGILAPNSALREQVVASAMPYVPPNVEARPDPIQLPLFGRRCIRVFAGRGNSTTRYTFGDQRTRVVFTLWETIRSVAFGRTRADDATPK